MSSVCVFTIFLLITLHNMNYAQMQVRINCVVIDDFNYDEIYDFKQISKNFNIDVRFIELTPYGLEKNLYESSYVNVKNMVEEMGEIEHIEYDYNSPARYYVFKNTKGRIGIIAPISNCFCNDCNKITLTSDGCIKLCIYDENKFDVKQYMHKPILFKEIIKDIIEGKPKTYNII